MKPIYIQHTTYMIQNTEHATHELWNKCHKNHLTEPLKWHKHTHMYKENIAKQNVEQNADEYMLALLRKKKKKTKKHSFEMFTSIFIANISWPF